MNITSAIERIRDCTKARVYIACTGAGAGAQQRIWDVPGCSSFLVGCEFPYAPEATERFLGFKPEKFCSAETAIDMAMESFMRSGADENAVGIGLSAAVGTNRERKGKNEIHAALVTAKEIVNIHVELSKFGTRRTGGNDADAIALAMVLAGAGTVSDDDVLLDEASKLAHSIEAWEEYAHELATDRFWLRPYFRSNGTRGPAPETLHAALPGTFNPPHAGHFGMAKVVALGGMREPTFWIEANPPHKQAASLQELLQRAAALRGHDVLFTSWLPLFIDKARRYPGCTFVIGADTMKRMLDPKWGADVLPMLTEFVNLGTTFAVFDRGDSTVESVLSEGIHGLELSALHRTRFVSYRGTWNVSSTALRERAP